MPLSNPPEPSTKFSSDLVDKPIVITEVKGESMVDTQSYGSRPVVTADVLVLSGFPGEQELVPCGDVQFFWDIVRDQLLNTEELPMAARIVKMGRSYKLQNLTNEELDLVDKLL